jgi:hypothetical protein
VPAVRFVRFAVIVWFVVPEPIACELVALLVVNVGSVPHSNQAFVAIPFGFALPFSVAAVVVTELAADVVTVGAGIATKSAVV